MNIQNCSSPSQPAFDKLQSQPQVACSSSITSIMWWQRTPSSGYSSLQSFRGMGGSKGRWLSLTLSPTSTAVNFAAGNVPSSSSPLPSLFHLSGRPHPPTPIWVIPS
ncbi:hypothetical protein TNIN_275781 [Trichonephila inaurata madagascariensis]|uniref:Uncharacterized protein n=1 Tax=Trichonephila inaurata madagascariensis TaxID=2747483 RepID=A0A8X7BTF5_9ARAC|nr:hypothetical protein TNIN_275781 [Trichonephila inaurata madagascariensis]